MKTIALLGATGHIGKALTNELASKEEFNVLLFSRSKEKIQKFLQTIEGGDKFGVHAMDEFKDHIYDVVINCTGIGSPSVLKDATEDAFVELDKIDDLVIEALKKYPETIYINLSSGAVYGNIADAVTEDTKVVLNPDPKTPGELYAAAKVKAEIKHRALSDLNIVDLRVFAFFSRFIDLSSHFLMADIVNCIKNKTVLKTMADNIQRDYIIASDLLRLINMVIKKEKINDVFDVYSLAPVSKFVLLESLGAKYGLKYEIAATPENASPTGEKRAYFSKNLRAGEMLGYAPKHTSLSGIEEEIAQM